MFSKKNMIFIMLILILFTLSAVSAADNATTDVVGLEDVNDDVISVEKTQTIGETENNTASEDKHNSFGDLENLIDDAKSGSTIILDRDYVNDDDYDSDGIHIDKDITIDGQGHTIDAKGNSRMFKIDDDLNVVFKNMTFINGYNNGNDDVMHWRSGGAIHGYCTAINCTFNENVAMQHGGAMYKGKAINCTFYSNFANSGGSDTDPGEGGATYDVEAILCSFEYNTAHEDKNGAMKGGSRLLCEGQLDECEDTKIILPSFNMIGDAETDLGGKVAFVIEYDNQKYDGIDIRIQTKKENGEGETFHISSGSEWTIPFVEGRNFTADVWGCPEIPELNGRFEIYSDVSPIKTNFTTEYDFEDNISIMIVDNLKRPMTNISVSYKIDGNVTETTTDEKGQIFIPVDNMKPDTYKIEINYKGEGNYHAMDKDITLLINKAITKLNANSYLITTYNLTEDLVITLTDNIGRALKGFNISAELNGTENYTTDKHGQIKISSEGLSPGTYIYQIIFPENDYYKKTNTTAKIVVNKIKTKLTASSVATFYNIEDNMIIYLIDAFGNPMSNATVSVNLNNTKNYTTDKNGQIKVHTKGLIPNVYHANVTFGGNEIYQKSNTTAEVVVNASNSKLIVTSLTTDYNSGEEFVVKLIDNLGNPVVGETLYFTLHATNNITDENGELNVSTNIGEGMEIILIDNEENPLSGISVSVKLINAKNYTTDENGQIKIAVKNVIPDIYLANIFFEGNKLYLKSNATSKIIVNKQSATLTANTVTTTFNDNKDLIITLKNDQGSPISGVRVFVDLDCVKNYTTDENGEIKIPSLNLVPDNYKVKITFNENSYYLGTSAETAVIVKKANTKLTVDSMTNSTNLIVSLMDEQGNPVNGTSISVDMKGINNYTTDSKGQINIPTDNLAPGNYNVKIKFNGNKNYAGSSEETTFIIKKSSEITANNVIANYNEIKHLIITLKDGEGKPIKNASVSVDLNGIKNHTTDSEGQIKIPIHKITPNNYDVKIKFDGNNHYIGTSTQTTVIVKKATSEITANSVTTIYNTAKNLVITLKDNAGNPITNTSLSVELNGATNHTTDENGQIKISTHNLATGNYNVKIKFDENSYYMGASTQTAVIVKKATAEITANNVTTIYNTAKNLVITLKNSAGNPIINTSVSVNLKGIKNYTTDEKGQIKIPVQKLTPKTYVAKVSYSGDNNYVGSDSYGVVVVKKITSKLTAKAKTFKVKTKTKKYSVILKTNKNKAIKNTKVYLKVNGKTYVAKTNSKGKATFKITKLTKKGKFTAVVTYKGSAYYNKVAKKVKIKIR